VSVKVKWYGAKAKAAARRGAVNGLREWADDVLTASQAEVPISPYSGGGFLKSTGNAEVDEGALRAAVSYDMGGNRAVFVHERTELQHTTGKAKFLEDAIRSMSGQVVDIIRRFAKR
jgi:hypothetical protein